MRIGEFVEAVESYGVEVPTVMKRDHRVTDLWAYRLGIITDTPQTKTAVRDYTSRHIRRLVAWLTLRVLVGIDDTPQHHQAMRLLAAAPCGYVVMSQGRAWWSYAPPVTALRSDSMAVAIPVPVWRH